MWILVCLCVCWWMYALEQVWELVLFFLVGSRDQIQVIRLEQQEHIPTVKSHQSIKYIYFKTKWEVMDLVHLLLIFDVPCIFQCIFVFQLMLTELEWSLSERKT